MAWYRGQYRGRLVMRSGARRGALRAVVVGQMHESRVVTHGDRDSAVSGDSAFFGGQQGCVVRQ